MTNVKLSENQKAVIEKMRQGNFLAVDKKTGETYMVCLDYSFHSNVEPYDFADLYQKKLIKWIDSRVKSKFYSLTGLGKSLLLK
jgi:hypothetical protein